MQRVVISLLFLTTLIGCNRAEKQSLKQLLETMVASLGHSYDDQLRGIPEPERNARFRVLFTRDQLVAVDAYLATKPPVSVSSRQEVIAFRTTKASELELYERLLAERRYELTEAEKKQEAELRTQAQQHMEAIGRLVDK